MGLKALRMLNITESTPSSRWKQGNTDLASFLSLLSPSGQQLLKRKSWHHTPITPHTSCQSPQPWALEWTRWTSNASQRPGRAGKHVHFQSVYELSELGDQKLILRFYCLCSFHQKKEKKKKSKSANQEQILLLLSPNGTTEETTLKPAHFHWCWK